MKKVKLTDVSFILCNTLADFFIRHMEECHFKDHTMLFFACFGPFTTKYAHFTLLLTLFQHVLWYFRFLIVPVLLSRQLFVSVHSIVV